MLLLGAKTQNFIATSACQRVCLALLTALCAAVALFFENCIGLFKAARKSVHLFLLRVTF
jgi:hypothetical protein